MKDEEEGKVRREGGRQRRRGRRKGKMYSGREKEQGRLGKGGGKKSGWKFTACNKRKERKFLSRKADGKAKCARGFSSCAAENTL